MNLIFSGQDTKVTDAGMPWPQSHHCSCRTNEIKFNNQRRKWDRDSSVTATSYALAVQQMVKARVSSSVWAQWSCTECQMKISKHQSPLQLDMTQLKTSTALAGSLMRTGHLIPSLPQVMDTTHSEGIRRQSALRTLNRPLTPREHTVLWYTQPQALASSSTKAHRKATCASL